MKKLLLLNLFLFTVHFFCLAQQAPGTTQLGIVAGPTHTFLRRAESIYPRFEELNSDVRAVAGLSLKHQYSRFFLKTDLLFENKGFQSNYRFPNDDYQLKEDEINSHYHYLALPILVGIGIKQTGFFVNAGPYVALLLKNKFTTDAQIPDYYQQDYSLDYDWKRDWKKLDYGISGGIGFSRSLTSVLQVSAELRHNLGLLNISKSNINHKTSSTSLLLGVHYSLPGK